MNAGLVFPENRLIWNGRRMRCALGKGGIRADKREGDGATPTGFYPFRRVFHRPDRLPFPECALPVDALTPADGWCDDPAHPDYNRFVTLPHPARCEHLWRDDGVYDLIVVLGHNDDPPKAGLGSAIFLHLAHPDFRPTEGCVALGLSDLLALLAAARPGDGLQISATANASGFDPLA